MTTASTDRPNILLFVTDAQQAQTVDPDHFCLTPNFDRLAARGVRFTDCHTTTCTCSPARASLMTGLLPHNHGVLEVEHGRDSDQCNLRLDKPHFAQRLTDAGYHTGYYGKWHIERTNDVSQFGWQSFGVKGTKYVKSMGKGQDAEEVELDPELTGYLEQPEGYNKVLHFGVTDTPSAERYISRSTTQAIEYINGRQSESPDQPWCCCVSYSEPNEALIASRKHFEKYDVDALPLPENMADDLSDRPGLYRRQRQIAQHLSDRHWRLARACYYARVTELDEQFGRLMETLKANGQIDNTIVIVTSDHGRYVGSHGFDAHNFGGFEEIWRIPLVVAGPGVAQGKVSDAKAMLPDLCPTLCELGGAKAIDVPDSCSLADVLADPDDAAAQARHATGFAEYHGTRFSLTQRILWQGEWKFVFNGFDFDELYNLADDPHETRNLADEPGQQERVKAMMAEVWRRISETRDRTILETHYFSMRFAAVGPNVVEDSR